MEDSFFLDAFNGLFAVFDGFGGGGSGELAEPICTNALVAFGNPIFPKKSPAAEPMLVQAIEHVAKAMKDSQSPGGSYENCQFGATVAAIQVFGNLVEVANVGEARVYRLRHDKIECLTRDHFLHLELVAQNKHTPEELEKIPKNILIRALGLGPLPKVDFSSVVAAPGDLFLVCTDGIHGLLSDEQIYQNLKDQLARNSDLDLAARTLIDAANAAGGSDNSAAVLVRIP